MSNAVNAFVFKDANACFQALCTAEPVTGTVVVVGNTPMRLEVGKFSARPVALMPLPTTSHVAGKGPGLWNLFVSLLRRLLGQCGTAPVMPSPRVAATIVARAEYTRRHMAAQALWLREATTFATSQRSREPAAHDGAGAALPPTALKDRIVAKFAPQTARALASIRALYTCLPADRAQVLARDLIGPIADRYHAAMERCRTAGMPDALCREAENAVWGALAAEMGKRIAGASIPDTVTDPAQRAAQKTLILQKAPRRVQRATGCGTREERLADAAKSIQEIDSSKLSEPIVMRNEFAKKRWADDPRELLDYAAMHIVTQLTARASACAEHARQVRELFDMVKKVSPATIGAVTAELARRWEDICAVSDNHGLPVALPEQITMAAAALRNGGSYYLTTTLKYDPLGEKEKAILRAAKAPMEGVK